MDEPDLAPMLCPGAAALLGSACHIECGRMVCPGKTRADLTAPCHAAGAEWARRLGLTWGPGGDAGGNSGG